MRRLCVLFALLLAFSGFAYGVDLTQTATSVLPDAATVQRASGVPGEAFSAGMPLYIKAADGLLYKALNTTAAAAACVGISEATGVVAQRTFYQTAGKMNVGATLTTGETYIVSGTAGKIAPIADISTNYVTYLGIAISTSQISLNITATGVLHGNLNLSRGWQLAALQFNRGRFHGLQSSY